MKALLVDAHCRRVTLLRWMAAAEAALNSFHFILFLKHTYLDNE